MNRVLLQIWYASATTHYKSHAIGVEVVFEHKKKGDMELESMTDHSAGDCSTTELIPPSTFC